MNCPSCKSGMLVAHNLEEKLQALNCNNCGGTWLYLDDYLRWLVLQSKMKTTISSSVDVNASETVDAMICPVSGGLMTKYHISADTSHRLDLSPTVNGVWLDKGEWELLKKAGLHLHLHDIVTRPWQKKIRRAESEKSQDEMYRNQFGEEQYNKLREVREWLHSQANCKPMLAYLTSEDPYA